MKEQPLPEWVGRPERSNTLALRMIVWVALTLGRPAARLLLYPVCLYFLIFSTAWSNEVSPLKWSNSSL